MNGFHPGGANGRPGAGGGGQQQHPGGGAGRPDNPANHPGNFNPQRPGGNPGQGNGHPNGIGDRANFGGIGNGMRPPNPGGAVGPHDFNGNVHPGAGGGIGAGNRNGNHTNVVNNHTQNNNQANISNRQNNNINNVNVNKNNVNVNKNVNRTTVINNTTNNFANMNRGGYPGGARPGYGWGAGGGGYRGWGYTGGGAGGHGGYWNHNPYNSYHQGWVNGYMNGHHATGWGYNNYNNIGNSALGWGVGIGVAAWGIGSLFNSWGYSNYANPYYGGSTVVVQQPAVIVQQPATVVVQNAAPVYDYSRPLDLQSPPPAQPVMEQAAASLDSAREAYRGRDYPGALNQVNRAIQQTPNDPMLHEFRAMCMFAMGRYDEAATSLYSVLSVGPGWDWTTQSGLYSDVGVYTQQLRALENFCDATPQAASARFVLGALYMTQGNNASAADRFKQVVALQPQDKLSAQLVAALTPKGSDDGSQNSAPASVASTPAPASAGPAASDPAVASNSAPQDANSGTPPAQPALPTGPVPSRLAGAWTTSPAKDTTITLSLDPAKGFSWKVVDHGQAREFSGSAGFDDKVLALSPSDQPPMVGTVAFKDDSHFLFKAVGGPPDDPGLTFSR